MPSSIETKVITLPERDDMEARLARVNDDPYAIQNFHPLILKDAGRELVASGVVLALQLAIHDYVQDKLPIMYGVMQMFVPGYIDVLIDDPDVKAEALAVLDKAKADAATHRANRPPADPRAQLSDDDKASLMRSIKRLAEVYDDCASDPSRRSDDYRIGGANPFYSQTQSGLFIEFYYGGPSKVWTPWGYWHFGAAQGYQFDLNAFMSRLTVREHIAVRHTQEGEYGPVYALLAIDGEALPEPSALTDKRQFTEYNDAKADWERFFDAS